MLFSRLKHIGVRLWVFALALQILNLSVHGGDHSRLFITDQQLSIGAFNQIDCFAEFFYEDILNLKGYNDIHDMALHNKMPGGHKLSPKFIDIQMPAQRIVDVSRIDYHFPATCNHFPKWENKYEYLFAQEITPPPPKNNFI